MNKLPFDASATVKGFIYQFLIALEKCFEMREGQSVYIECHGDVSIEGINEASQIETKNYTRSLTDLDINVWKTIANWIDSVFPIDKYDSLVLKKKKKVGTTSKWLNWNNHSVEDRKEVINDIAKKKIKSPELKSLMAKIFADGNKDRLSVIIGKMVFDTNKEDGKVIYENLRRKYTRGVPEIQKDKYLQALYGFIIGKYHAGTDWVISNEEFNKECEELTNSLVEHTAVFPQKKNLEDIKEEDFSNNQFVEKIHAIKYEEQISEAIKNYIYAGTVIKEDLEISPSLKKSFVQYEEEIETIFEGQYRKACRHCSESEIIPKSQDFYDDITTAPTGSFYRYSSVPITFRNGVVHILSEEKTNIMWRLKPNQDE